MKVIYLTFDGILQPIAQANVIPYLQRLAADGYALTLVSLERTCDLSEGETVAAMHENLAQSGIQWQPLPYSIGGGLAMARNFARAYRSVRRLTRRDSQAVIHSRSYPPAAVAWAATRAGGGRYIFDMRGYWVDEKRAVGRWFVRPRIYAVAKAIERRLVRDAAAVVTLTHLQAGDLQPLRPAGDAIAVVRTCTDFRRWEAPARLAPPALRERLAGKLVIAYVGSDTNSYMLHESVALFARIHALRPDAHLLCLAREGAALRGAVAAASIPESAWSLQSVPYSDMPAWLALAHWGLLLLQPGLAKRGSVPTKLAEFLAAGVRPIFYGCNAEVADLVRLAGSGLVIEEMSPASLQWAAAAVASRPLDPQSVNVACARARSLLDLEIGATVYRNLYRSVVGPADMTTGPLTGEVRPVCSKPTASVSA